MENGQPILIRPATEADIPSIAAITHEAFLLYAQQVGIPSAIGALSETEEDVRRALAQKKVLVSLLGDQIVGSVRYEDLGGGIGYLSRFGVTPALQQGGVGSALIEAVAQGCRDMGLSAVALHTGARIGHLVCFYYRSGYFIHSTTHDRGYVRALFVRELSDAPYDLSAALSK